MKESKDIKQNTNKNNNIQQILTLLLFRINYRYCCDIWK